MSKRLTKGDSFDSMISGVCSGIAEYFDIDVTILRFIWVICILFHGWGLLPYIILAIIMPNKR
jgi:phage shock protein PspC (stress-responsive transcriptional regulator)